MIDYVTIKVSDLEKSKSFYEQVFTSLGYKLSFGEEGKFFAFDIGNGLFFEIAAYKSKNPITSTHITFRVTSQEM